MTFKINIEYNAKAKSSSNPNQTISCTVFETILNTEGSKKLDEIIQNDTSTLLDTYTLLEKSDKSPAIPLGVKTIPNDFFDSFMKFILGAILFIFGFIALLLSICGGLGAAFSMSSDINGVALGLGAAIVGGLLFRFILKSFKYTDEKTIPFEFLLCFLFLDNDKNLSKIIFRKCSHPKYGDICRSVTYFNQK